MDLPDVTHHDIAASLNEVQAVCEQYVDKHKKPCGVVTIDGEYCYAFMDLDGSSGMVHCFIKPTEEMVVEVKNES